MTFLIYPFMPKETILVFKLSVRRKKIACEIIRVSAIARGNRMEQTQGHFALRSTPLLSDNAIVLLILLMQTDLVIYIFTY